MGGLVTFSSLSEGEFWKFLEFYLVKNEYYTAMSDLSLC
jgi:hypothetical protein